MTKPGSVPAEAYRLCFEHSPWPTLLVDRTRLLILDANAAARALLPVNAGPEPALASVLDLDLGQVSLPLSLQADFLGQAQPCLIQALGEDLILVQLLRDSGGELERLEQISQRKSELIANISHELRTPLTAILGWPEIILDAEGMPALAIQAAQAIRKDGVFLRQLLDDLIDLSRIEAGHLQLDVQSEDLCQIVLDAVDMLAEKSRQKNLRLESRLPAQAVWVAVDPLRMMQIVINYLSNAIKYTAPGGRILLQVQALDEEAVLSLQDNGIGMDENVRQHVFERFMRADEVQFSDGAGIGLSLVKKLVALHSGSCWVESEPGEGSTFYVSLPLARSRAARELRNQAQSQRGLRRLALTQLLLIDPSSEELGLLEQLLQPYFRQVRGESGLPDLELLKARRPDLVLLSTSLQEKAHLAWLQALRQDAEIGTLPVIALSASAMKGDAEKLEDFGYSGSLSKPFLKEDLLQYIQQILARTHHV